MADWSKCSHSVFHSAFGLFIHLSIQICILFSLLSTMCPTAVASNRNENHTTVYHKTFPCINDDVTVGNNSCRLPRTVQNVLTFNCLFYFYLGAFMLGWWSSYWMDLFPVCLNSKNKLLKDLKVRLEKLTFCCKSCWRWRHASTPRRDGVRKTKNKKIRKGRPGYKSGYPDGTFHHTDI